jgi:hypothetical protein
VASPTMRTTTPPSEVGGERKRPGELDEEFILKKFNNDLRDGIMGGGAGGGERDLGGCAVFATFFIHFEANLSEYGSYSLHIRMFRYLRQHHLSASFASYSLQNIRTNSQGNIYFHIQANIRLQVFAY